MIDYLIKLERYISGDKNEEAFKDFQEKLNLIIRKRPTAKEEVSEVKKILILLSSQYHEIKKQQRYGIIESESARVAFSKITIGFANLIDDLSKYEEIYSYLLYEDEENLWLSAANFNSWQAIEEYLERYPKGKYITEAKHMKKELDIRRRKKYLTNNKENGYTKALNNTETPDLQWWKNLTPPWKAFFSGKLKLKKEPAKSDFEALNNITRINIQGNREILSLDPIRKLKKIQFLNIIDTKITSLAVLSELKALQVIWLRFTAINDLSPLRGLENLVELDFSNTEVCDLSPLSELKKLKKINCSMTNVNSLYPIYDMENLKYLYCDTYLLKDESIDNYELMNPNVEVNNY